MFSFVYHLMYVILDTFYMSFPINKASQGELVKRALKTENTTSTLTLHSVLSPHVKEGR